MSLGGYVIRLEGDPTNCRANGRDLTHISETALDDYPFEFVIQNNSTLDHLYEEVNWNASITLGSTVRHTDYIDCFQFLVRLCATHGLHCGLAYVFHYNTFVMPSKPRFAASMRIAQHYISHGARLSSGTTPSGGDWETHFNGSGAWRNYVRAWYESTCEEATRNHAVAKDAVMTVLAIRKHRQSVLSRVPRDVLLLIVRGVWEARHDFEQQLGGVWLPSFTWLLPESKLLSPNTHFGFCWTHTCSAQ